MKKKSHQTYKSLNIINIRKSRYKVFKQKPSPPPSPRPRLLYMINPSIWRDTMMTYSNIQGQLPTLCKKGQGTYRDSDFPPAPG
jgi:hypothetical protein